MQVWTDGSCSPNPGRGGWAFITKSPEGREFFDSGFMEETTNNRAEMMAAIEALRFLQGYLRPIIVYSDSMLLINGMKGIWKKKKNIDLWKELALLNKDLDTDWIWVKGHATDMMNERVNDLAQEETFQRR